MENILIVVDMQNDFVDGVLGTPEAAAVLPAVAERIRNHRGRIIFTRDTHTEDYMSTREGKYLPVPHCIKDTTGWEIHADVWSAIPQDRRESAEVSVIDKPTFGSTELAITLESLHTHSPISTVTLIGVCTDICVISNAMLIKATLPEVDVVVDAACCAGVTPESHENALAAMTACQIIIENS